jgi:hypothetical protein
VANADLAAKNKELATEHSKVEARNKELASERNKVVERNKKLAEEQAKLQARFELGGPSNCTPGSQPRQSTPRSIGRGRWRSWPGYAAT